MRNISACSSFVMAWLCGLVLTAVPVAADSLLSVWNFDDGILTEQGGYYNHYGARGSTASLFFDESVRRGESGRSLRVEYDKKAEGYCGLWFHLFSEAVEEEERTYLDISEHLYLSLWVRGAKGGEDFSVQLADPVWLEKEDSKSAGLASKYLRTKLTTAWQEIVVPFEDFKLASPDAAAVTLNFNVPGNGTIYVDDITFKKHARVAVPATAADRSKQRIAKREFARAMWVWEVEPLLQEEEKRAELFTFCRERKINELFLQLPYRFESEDSPEVVCIIRYPWKLKAFLKAARNEGILCHALDGYPEFVLTDYHPRVMAQVYAILQFNASAEPEERFYGIHLDNEPYQLLGFEGPGQVEILEQFLQLNQEVMMMIGMTGEELVYGIDIPFWFDEQDESSGERCIVDFNGQRKDAAKHLIDLVDNVGIMDYRNFAGGADGMIRHGQDEVAYASKVGKQIYLGVETFKYEPTTISFLYGVKEDEWLALGRSGDAFQFQSKINGFNVRSIKAASNRLVGLAQPADLKNRAAFDQALATLYERYGVTSSGLGASIEAASFDAEYAISKDGRFEGFDEFTVTSDEGDVIAHGFHTTERMLEKITFADKTKRDIEVVLGEVAAAFADEPSLVGFAIHYYKTYKKLPNR